MANNVLQKNDQTYLPYSRPFLVILTTNPGLVAPSPSLETSASSSRTTTTQYDLSITLSSASSWAEVGQSLFVGASLTEGESRGWGAYKPGARWGTEPAGNESREGSRLWGSPDFSNLRWGEVVVYFLPESSKNGALISSFFLFQVLLRAKGASLAHLALADTLHSCLIIYRLKPKPPASQWRPPQLGCDALLQPELPLPSLLSLHPGFAGIHCSPLISSNSVWKYNKCILQL